MLLSYLAKILCHRPERSGLPSAVRGAGAVRFGLRSGVRGMPGVGYFSHCAARGVVIPKIANATIINSPHRNLVMISAPQFWEMEEILYSLTRTAIGVSARAGHLSD